MYSLINQSMKNIIKEEELNHLLELCKLDILPEERDIFLSDINRIIQYIGKIGEMDLEDVEPFYYPSAGLSPLSIEKILEREQVLSVNPSPFLQNAPSTYGRFIAVPKYVAPGEEKGNN